MSTTKSPILEKSLGISEFFERLEQVRRHFGLTQKQFSAMIGMLPSYYSDLKRGKTNPSMQFLFVLADKFPSINFHWLITGEGEMLVKSANERRQEEFAQEFARRLREPVGPYSPARQEKIQKMIKQIKERLKADIAALDELLEPDSPSEDRPASAKNFHKDVLLRRTENSGE